PARPCTRSRSRSPSRVSRPTRAPRRGWSNSAPPSTSRPSTPSTRPAASTRSSRPTPGPDHRSPGAHRDARAGGALPRRRRLRSPRLQGRSGMGADDGFEGAAQVVDFRRPRRSLEVVIPYRHARDERGFAIHRPKLLRAVNLPDVLEPIIRALYRGVDAHEEG